MILLSIIHKIVRLNIRLIVKAIRVYVKTKSLPLVVDVIEGFQKKPWTKVEPKIPKSFNLSKKIKFTDLIDYIAMNDGNRYYMCKTINSVRQVQLDYNFEDIEPSDIVIDVGACIGGFSIPASRKAKHVYAIEPMTPDMVTKNVLLNERNNISVLPIGLGDGKLTQIEWQGNKKLCITKTLVDIKQECGGCDFLKIDCEGCEWCIKPKELQGVRRIEMEVHNIGYPITMMEHMLTEAGFDYTITLRNGKIGLWIIHAERSKIK
jgi:FkbM family methyltransferase